MAYSLLDDIDQFIGTPSCKINLVLSNVFFTFCRVRLLLHVQLNSRDLPSTLSPIVAVHYDDGSKITCRRYAMSWRTIFTGDKSHFYYSNSF